MVQLKLEKMKKTRFILLLAFVALFLASCSKKPDFPDEPGKTYNDNPGIEYMPDMYHSIPLEPYSQIGDNPIFKNGTNAQNPPKNTIPRGFTPYHIPNTPEGYDSSKVLVNPIKVSDEVLAEGKAIFTTFCAVCHNNNGDGQGSIVKNGGYPPPPSYSKLLAGKTDGEMFHSITYGKNLMGSYASQINTKERWTVIHYIKTLVDKGVVAGGNDEKKEEDKDSKDTN